jgi:hypothetical protein
MEAEVSLGTRTNTDLRTIPGVGPSIEIDLVDLGIRAVRELKGRNPDQLYDDLCRLRGERIDPCVKYVFRCAVYFASNELHEPALLQWWNWKERPPGV